MGESSSFASLGPTLLARKGGAKPAMRPQVAPLTTGGAQALATDPEELEDLGWNDMGHAEDKPHEAQILALTPMSAHHDEEADFADELEEEGGEEDDDAPSEPPVLMQRRQIATAVAASPREPRRKVANDVGRRAAFTLRLDARRHLKLRLASTVKNRSAQQLVTQALDKFLADIPEIDALAAQVTLD